MYDRCYCHHKPLPYVKCTELVKCIRLTMDNGKSYTVKIDDMVGIQFIKDDKRILVRRGRIKDIFIVNRRELTTNEDNVSHIVLDCSEQFSVKIIDIKLKDIIDIKGYDDEFTDYSDRIENLEPNYIEGDRLPIRQDGLVTEEEAMNKIAKPNRDDVVKMDPDTGRFDDLYEMNQNRPDLGSLRIPKETIDDDKKITPRGVAIRM